MKNNFNQHLKEHLSCRELITSEICLCYDLPAIYCIPNTYWIPCECRKVYVRQNVRTIKARCKEHHRSIRLHRPESAAAAEHSINMHHCINLSGTSIFNRTSGHVDHLVNKATEINLNKNTLNRESGFILSQAWSPIIKSLMEVI